MLEKIQNLSYLQLSLFFILLASFFLACVVYAQDVSKQGSFVTLQATTTPEFNQFVQNGRIQRQNALNYLNEVFSK